MSERPIDLARVSAVVETLLRDSGKPVCVTDLTTGEIQLVSPQLAASPAGLLPPVPGRRGYRLAGHHGPAAGHQAGG